MNTREFSSERSSFDWKTIEQGLDLIPIEANSKNRRLQNPNVRSIEVVNKFDSETLLREMETIFDNVETIPSERVCRPKGDTTLFTSSGIQRLESDLRANKRLENRSFSVIQPVIRSQFIDRAKEGTSSSFLNVSVIQVGANWEDYIKRSTEFISFLCRLGFSPNELLFESEDNIALKGGVKTIHRVLKVFYQDKEIGDAVFIPEYPSGGSLQSVIDVGCGVERILWALGRRKYFSAFNDFYETGKDSDLTASAIDAIRSMVLICSEGILPALHDQGYRFRQLSKRFVNRNLTLKLNDAELIKRSAEEWDDWGHRSEQPIQEISKIIAMENERNYNNLILEACKIQGTKIYVDINQPTDTFLAQIRRSAPSLNITKIIESYEQ